ncbi:probable calcium-binding protein CML25 [Malania oleifera]|uniref:probable calcium-binding protein CML25 n=1 Tax=Malania oleifera TaxID=397392 RepID=UPI0025ADEC6C|nr:probable calcium-binding protein CML25 [Malania oleifera]
MGFRSFFSRKKKSNSSANNTPVGSGSESASLRSHIEELELVFKKFDVNGDGKISSSELGSIMGSLGQPSSEEEVHKMIVEFDADGDGCIDLDEFIELNTKGVDFDEALENLKDAFSVYDIDGNGSISAEELQEVMRSLGDDCSIAECRKMISGADCDGDGTISFEEFKIMMMTGSRFDTLESERRAVNVE